MDAAVLVTDLATRARAAHRVLARAPTVQKADALRAAAAAIRARATAILAANADDIAAASALSPALIDRLTLNSERIEGIAAGLAAVAALPDPVGTAIDTRTRPNGLRLDRIRVPIGVIGLIYESRPNVTADAGALALMAGNAAILRGGSEATHSNAALHACLAAGLEAANLPVAAVQMVPTTDRAVVGALLVAHGQIDLIVPRGGKSLVARVQAEARVPVLAHLDGINHIYVDFAADPAMATRIVLDAKLRRTGVCGAMETLLIHRDWPHAAALVTALRDAGCEVRGGPALRALVPGLAAASADDWDTEYLDAIVTAGLVDGLDRALIHIAAHGSGHTDAIVTADAAAAERFLAEVDSAIVLWNASTQFADGAEFGLGAEIGIATGRLHARGPVALEGLTTYKWIGRGAGEIGMIRTGLLGGSFNPAHRGHRGITLAAIAALGLDEAWWLVSPGNPLKPDTGMAPLAARLASARRMARHAPIRASAIETKLGTRYTIDTLRALQRRYPKRRFVWLMGADNLAQFHRWRDWRRIARTVPIAVVARPGYERAALRSPAFRWFGRFARPSRGARKWTEWRLPALVILRVRPDPTSATALRAADPNWSRHLRIPRNLQE